MGMERSERSAYIGVHVRPEAKTALQELAAGQQHGDSVSAIVSRWVDEKLTELGVSLRREPDPRERPLPFEEAR